MRVALLAVSFATYVALSGIGHAQDLTPRTPQQIDADLLAQMRNQPIESFIAKLLAPIRSAHQPDRLTREEVEASRSQGTRDATRQSGV